MTNTLLCGEYLDLEVLHPNDDGSHCHRWDGDGPNDCTACSGIHFIDLGDT
jgi:hypothetical protein